MNDTRFSPQLPANAARHLAAVRRLEAPVDLVDNIMAEVEATPQVRPAPTVQVASGVLLVAAAVLLGIALLLRIGTPNVGPSPTPIPLDELPSAGNVLARISVEAEDVPVAFGHGYLWLTNAATGELVRMDPANGSIASPLQIADPDVGVAIAVSSSAVFIAERGGSTVIELDPASLDERRRMTVSVGVSALASDGTGGLWVLDADAGALIRVDLADGGEDLNVPINGSALLVHAGAVWVTDAGGGLVRIDPSSGTETGRTEIGFVADQLVALGDSIVAAARGQPVVRVRIANMSLEARGPRSLGATAQEGRVWVVTPSGHLARLDADSLQPLTASAIDLEASGPVLVGAGSVWTAGRDAAGDAFLLQFSTDE